MATMPELKSPVALAIEAHYEASETPRDGKTISPTMIGEPCDRSVWYSFRWVSPLQRFDGRMLRLFQTGHIEEARMLDDLRAIGVTVLDRDPETGGQWEINLLNGLIHGFADARLIGLPGAEKTEHVGECKTMNDKSFQDWRRQGMFASKPNYYAQGQLYAHAFGLSRIIFVVKNKNTDEIETERVQYDATVALRLIAKAERIARADTPPAKAESYACRWCKHEKICRHDDWPRSNCRTCLHASVSLDDGQWRCTAQGAVLTIDQQRAGCGAHRFIPDLVPGEQVDVEGENVVYELRVAGARWTDGVDAKPTAPEVAP